MSLWDSEYMTRTVSSMIGCSSTDHIRSAVVLSAQTKVVHSGSGALRGNVSICIGDAEYVYDPWYGGRLEWSKLDLADIAFWYGYDPSGQYQYTDGYFNGEWTLQRNGSTYTTNLGVWQPVDLLGSDTRFFMTHGYRELTGPEPWTERSVYLLDNVDIMFSDQAVPSAPGPTTQRSVMAGNLIVTASLSDHESPSATRALSIHCHNAGDVPPSEDVSPLWSSFVLCDADADSTLGLSLLPSGRLVVTYVVGGTAKMRYSDCCGRPGTWSAEQTVAYSAQAAMSARDDHIAWKVRT